MLRGRRPLSSRARFASVERLRFPASPLQQFPPRPDHSAVLTAGWLHQTDALKLVRLRQTESSQRIISRVSKVGTIGIFGHEQRRSGNPLIIFMTMGRLVLPSSAFGMTGEAELAMPSTEKPVCGSALRDPDQRVAL